MSDVMAVPAKSTPAAAADRLTAAIFDVDGVLLASPHERAWREALAGYADPARFTTAVYEAQVAGKPRMAGALAALKAMGVLGIAPVHCFVAEDAPAGIQAAHAGGMAALGVARLHDEAGLVAQHASLVVTSLDEVALDGLAAGRLCRTPA